MSLGFKRKRNKIRGKRRSIFNKREPTLKEKHKRDRMKHGGYFIDWSDFPEVVMKFIRRYPTKDLGSHRLIPQSKTIKFIMTTYDCCWKWAKHKLSLLVGIEDDLEWEKNKSYDKNPFAPPREKWYIRLRLKASW